MIVSLAERPGRVDVEKRCGGGLAVDATYVYWTTAAGAVARVAIAGGAPTTLATGEDNPCGIAVDGERVFWVDAVSAGRLRTVPTPGTAMRLPEAGGTPVTIADTQATPVAIDVDATGVYWSGFGAAEIHARSLDGTGPIQTIAEDQDGPAFG